MANQIGKRYQCRACGSEMIVTKGGDGSLTCCGRPMQLKAWVRATAVPNQLGKRFRCQACGTEVLCTKAGDGSVECCGRPMEQMQPKVLPSAD